MSPQFSTLDEVMEIHRDQIWGYRARQAGRV